MKRIGHIMKKITGKSKLNSNRFLKSINANGKAIKKNNHIAEEFEFRSKSGQQNTKHI